METLSRRPFLPTNLHELTRMLLSFFLFRSNFVPSCLRGSLFSLLLLSSTSFAQTTEFSQDNAYAILKTLVLDIGARPMGSPAEQRAMRFAVSKFKEYGCDTSYVMPMMVAEGVNTKSGVAIGVKKGRSSRIIVIGGHIDTSGPDIPGANDDGSGTACVIELARVLAKRDNESTIYFCCWGGEEQGLRGSEHFVNNFERLDSVALMLQIDMADGAGKLHADPDGSKTSAPSWLVKSAYDIFYNELPHDGLDYPTEEATWNLASGGTFGSDHIPFIDKGIPAIDFTSDPTFPIHTPQDSWVNFTPSGLQRTGDLVLKLVERFDGGVPSRTTEKYQLVQIGKHVFFIPYALLWTFIGVSLISLIVAFVVARRRRLHLDPITKVKWSRLKLIVAALVIQTFIWSSESVLGLIKGYRFPWVNNVLGFKILGLLFGLVGLWFVLQAVRKYRLSEDAYVFARLSIFPFLILTVLASYVTPELGMFVAASALAFAVAVIGRKPMFKLLFFALSFLIFYNLIFFDGLPLFQRLLASNGMTKWWQNVLADVGFILVFTGLSLPFVHGFATVYRGSGVDLFWMKKFTKRSGLIVTSLAIVAVAGYLFVQPVYGNLWFNSMRIEQLYTLGENTSSVTLKGSEYVDGLNGMLNGRDTILTENTNRVELDSPSGSRVQWADVTRSAIPPMKISDSTWKVERTTTIHAQFRPLRIDVTYESEKPFELESQWAHGPRTPDPAQRETERRKRFRWAFFTDTLLTIPVSFTLRDSQRVQERIEIAFDSVAYPIRLRRDFTNVSYRTIVTARDSFFVMK
jgi:hypothetical protein